MPISVQQAFLTLPPRRVGLSVQKTTQVVRDEMLAAGLARTVEALVGVRLGRGFYHYWLIALILKFPGMLMAERCRVAESEVRRNPGGVRALWARNGWIERPRA